MKDNQSAPSSSAEPAPPLKIYGNHLPPDAPAALHVTPERLAELQFGSKLASGLNDTNNAALPVQEEAPKKTLTEAALVQYLEAITKTARRLERATASGTMHEQDEQNSAMVNLGFDLIHEFRQLESSLSVSIRERETLTNERRRFGQFAARAERIYSAHVPRLGIVADRLFDADDRAAIAVVVGFLSDIASEPKLIERGTTEYDRQLEELRAAVARLSSEKAIAEAERDSARASRDTSLDLLERQEATLASRTLRIAQLEEQLDREKNAHFHTTRERDRLSSDIRAHKSWGKHL